MPSRPNLKPIRTADIAVALVGFVLGLLGGLVGWDFIAPVDADAGPFGIVLLALPLILTPFTYLFGFFMQEATLPNRSQRARLVSSIICGGSVVLLLILVIMLGDAVQQFIELPQWLSLLVVTALVFIGPFATAAASAWVERRIFSSAAETHDAS